MLRVASFASRKQSIGILGGGISGLSAAVLAQDLLPHCRVQLIEGSKHVGGWIRSERQPNSQFLFELGPNSIRLDPSRVECLSTVRLLDRVGLSNEVLPANDFSARRRFALQDGRVRKLGLSTFFANPPLLGAILSDLLTVTPRLPAGSDESVASMFERRLGPHSVWLAELLCSGIYAGSARLLSASATFPRLWLASQARSMLLELFRLTAEAAADRKLLQAQLRALGSSKIVSLLSQGRPKSVSFRNGLQTFTDALAKQLDIAPIRNNRVVSLQFPTDSKGDESSTTVEKRAESTSAESSSMTATTASSSSSPLSKMVTATLDDGTRLEFDHVISALPAYCLSDLLRPHHPDASALLSEVRYTDVGVVHLGFGTRVVPPPLVGFGYLVPHAADETILGVFYNSLVFPQQLGTASGTFSATPTSRLAFLSSSYNSSHSMTVMMGGELYRGVLEHDEEELVQIAVESVRKHLMPPSVPKLTEGHAHVHRRCIPQYNIGHNDLVKRLLAPGVLPSRLSVIGNYLHGVSINDCIATAENTVKSLRTKLKADLD